MPYSANVVNVMVASPSDVSQERRIVRDEIAEWNVVHAYDRKTVLLPLGWETHTMPEVGDRPQAIINAQMLKNADLLVAMFWTRIGTPTGVAKSGTVEEIAEHIGKGKPTMIYFSSAPVRPDSIDNAQYAEVVAFKNSLKAKGLYQEYESLAGFQSAFRRQLAQTIIAHFAPGAPPTPAPSATPGPGLPEISETAAHLLSAASSDPQGVILRLQSQSGTLVETNGTSFVEAGNSRSEAQWRGAVAELNRLGLIEDRAGAGEVFSVTDAGYRAVDALK